LFTSFGDIGEKMTLKIHFLGQPRLMLDGHPVDLPGYRPLALLAYLILSRRPFPREHLIDLLFDGPDDPRAALRWTLSKLRSAIGSQYILTDKQEVAFNFQSDFWLDVFAFEAGETDAYQGDFLEGLYLRDALRFEDWLSFERQRLRAIYQDTLENQLKGFIQQSDHAAVVITAQQLLKVDYLREDWHYALINAYGQLGKRATALEQYEKCRQMLRKEWGLDPAPETVALAESIQNMTIRPQALPIEPERMEARKELPEITALQQPTAGQFPEKQTRPLRGTPAFVLTVMASAGIVTLIAFLFSRIFNFDSQLRNAVGQLPANESETDPNGANSPELAGTKVVVFGPFYDEYEELFTQSIQPFEINTGIDVEFRTGTETYFNERLAQDDLPDIVLFPQPGRLVDLTKQGKVIDLGEFLDEAYLAQQYPEVFLDLAVYDGQIMGAWFSAGLKSLVWYPKRAFEARGYEVPETWDELIALSDQIVSDGDTPWCIGVGDQIAEGWVGTDWVEDILLRTAPPEVYDAWVSHTLPFNSPEILRAFEIMGQIWLNDDYVYGGVANILKEHFMDSPSHLFTDPPGCFLHRQGSFTPYLFPSGVQYGEDYDFFYLPPIDPQFGHPVLGGGDIAAMFNDRPEVREAMRYLTTPESAKFMISSGGYLSPYKGTPIEWFPTAADLRFNQIILSADTYRFDGSDMMPEEVGFGAFYHGIADWINGKDLETVLQEIDASWPDE